MHSKKSNVLVAIVACLPALIFGSQLNAQDGPLTGPLLEDEEAFLLTVFLKHDQTMNIQEINELAAANLESLDQP